ncbi:caspase, EACC1-associated type [Nocardia vinacea]|uniref:caspase, EACC1-associated type n=1 Tax=Nocardia vinacea TaxID=96468 RepID=UPI0002E1118E|nr:caspase family protein [Nocardia vinacea]
MARLQMPPIPPGPLRDLIGTLFELHGKANWPSMDAIAKGIKAKGISVGKTSVHQLFVSGELPSPDLLLQVTEYLAEIACERKTRHNETVDDWCDKIDDLFQTALRDEIYNSATLATTVSSPAHPAESTAALGTPEEFTGAVTTMGAALPDRNASAAVLTGISNYTHPTLGPLPGTSEQVQRLHDLITDSDEPVFDPATVAFLDAPSRTELLDAIARATESAVDTVLFYFAGHGLVSRRGELLLAGPETDPDAEYTAIAFQDIRDLITASKAKRTVVVLDACYSGQATKTQGALDGLSYIPTSLVLTAAGPYQAALRDDDGPLFTRTLNNILEQGIPHGPPILDIEILYQELRRQAEQTGEFPIPHLAGQTGTRPLALAPNRAASHRLEPSRANLITQYSTVTSDIPSVARPPQARARRTRAAIIRSAAVEFSKSGYAAASLNRILEGSRATKGAMYFQFDSKEEIAHAVMYAARDRYRTSTERWLTRNDLGPLDALHGMIDEIALRMQSDVIVQAELQLIIEPEFYRDFPASGGHILAAAIRLLVVRAIEHMHLSPDSDPDRISRTLAAALAGQRYIADVSEGPMDLRSRFAETLEVIIEGAATAEWMEEFRRNGWRADARLDDLHSDATIA